MRWGAIISMVALGLPPFPAMACPRPNATDAALGTRPPGGPDLPRQGTRRFHLGYQKVNYVSWNCNALHNKLSNIAGELRRSRVPMFIGLQGTRRKYTPPQAS